MGITARSAARGICAREKTDGKKAVSMDDGNYAAFSPEAFLASAGLGHHFVELKPGAHFFTQGDSAQLGICLTQVGPACCGFDFSFAAG